MNNINRFTGAVAILPTLLYLTTGVIRETAIRTDNDVAGIGPGAPVHGALHCLKSLMTDKYATDTRSEQQWNTLLQSALAKIVDLAKTGEYITRSQLPFSQCDSDC